MILPNHIFLGSFGIQVVMVYCNLHCFLSLALPLIFSILIYDCKPHQVCLEDIVSYPPRFYLSPPASSVWHLSISCTFSFLYLVPSEFLYRSIGKEFSIHLLTHGLLISSAASFFCAVNLLSPTALCFESLSLGPVLVWTFPHCFWLLTFEEKGAWWVLLRYYAVDNINELELSSVSVCST